jgi:NTP pyrophosphatase (non-canonical NTP hydrolase)
LNDKQYVQLALVTEAKDWPAIVERVQQLGTLRLLHAMMGVQTESGEFTDALKRFIFYGKPIDKVNLGEELGDLFWYIAIACDELGISFEQVWENNIAKLKARYGEKFSEAAALNRNLPVERKVLER